MRHGRISSCGVIGASTPRLVRRSAADSFAPGLRRRDPVPGRAQAVVERRGRAPAELALGAATRRAPSGCTSPSRAGSNAGSAVAARDRRARAMQLEHARLAAGADVEDAAAVAGRGEQRVDDVADEDEVARLAAVAEDRRRLPAREALEEDRDDAALEARLLPRAEDVAEAERDVPAAVDAVPAGEVLLGAELRDPVRRERLRAARPRPRGRRTRRRSRRRSRRRRPARRRAAPPRAPARCRRRSPARRGRAARPRSCTSACAARWKTTSAPPRSSPSRMSRSTKVAAALRFSRLPVERSSTAIDLVAALDEPVDEIRPDEPGTTGHDRPHAAVS